MWQLLVVLVMTLAYFGLQELVSCFKLSALWALFLIVPLALTPHWLKTNSFDLFVWIKIYSILFCIGWAGWLRFTTMGDKPWLRRTIAWLLVGNILEALVLDIQGTGFTHQFNALAGILLIATIPFTVRHTHIERACPHQTLHCDLPLAWICGYTLWNWTFVYLNYPAYLGHHTAILCAALAVAWFEPQRWVQARAATLGLNLLWMATSNSSLLGVSNTTNWFNAQVAAVAAAFTLAWMAVHAASLFKTRLVLHRPLAISQTVREHLERVTTEWQDTDSTVVSWCVR